MFWDGFRSRECGEHKFTSPKKRSISQPIVSRLLLSDSWNHILFWKCMKLAELCICQLMCKLWLLHVVRGRLHLVLCLIAMQYHIVIKRHLQALPAVFWNLCDMLVSGTFVHYLWVSDILPASTVKHNMVGWLCGGVALCCISLWWTDWVTWWCCVWCRLYQLQVVNIIITEFLVHLCVCVKCRCCTNFSRQLSLSQHVTFTDLCFLHLSHVIFPKPRWVPFVCKYV